MSRIFRLRWIVKFLGKKMARDFDAKVKSYIDIVWMLS